MNTAELLATVRRNVRIIREGRGLSQSELARRIGKSPGYICDLERGRRAPNLSTLAAIARGLDVDSAILLLPPEPTRASLVRKIRKMLLTACTALWYAGRKF